MWEVGGRRSERGVGGGAAGMGGGAGGQGARRQGGITTVVCSCPRLTSWRPQEGAGGFICLSPLSFPLLFP